MPENIINDLCGRVAQRLREMGITQARLSELSGLSRATIASIEGMSIKELGLGRAQTLLGILGLQLYMGSVENKGAHMGTALERCLVIANRRQRLNMDADKLGRALTDGVQLLDYGLHSKTVLENTEIGLLAEMVEELHEHHGLEKSSAWKKIRALAGQVKASCPYWD
jgi:transcriptional regulator with XRE-family HTH domain